MLNEVVSDRLYCLEPEYRNFINPLYLRRMPRIIKMGLAAAQQCVKSAGEIIPEGIVVGTGLGCLDNLEKFLIEVIDSDENVKSMLGFINSTHNAVAAQIAMLLKNHSYNVTYCHRALSFESALYDAMMLLDEGAGNVLVGGIDECTDDFMKLHGYLNAWKKPVNNLSLIEDHGPGSIAGEGSAFFMLSSEKCSGKINIAVKQIRTFLLSSQDVHDNVIKEMECLFKAAAIDKNDIDAVILGLNGDYSNDDVYYKLQNDYFSAQTGMLYYKHLCGEYYTSGAFALWLAKIVLQNNHIPERVCLQKTNRTLRNILIFNHFRNTEHSLILLANE